MLVSLIRKDFYCMWRARQLFFSTFSFSLLLVVVASFSLRQVGYDEVDLKQIFSGILWIIFLFSGVLGLNYSSIYEMENDAVFGVLFTKVSPGIVYLSKFLSLTFFLLIVQLFCVCTLSLFFAVNVFPQFPQFVLLGLLVTIGFSSLGTILSSISVVTRGREMVLPLVLFPLCIPLVASAVFLTRSLLIEQNLDPSQFWFILLIVFDVIAFTLSWVLFEFVLWE